MRDERAGCNQKKETPISVCVECGVCAIYTTLVPTIPLNWGPEPSDVCVALASCAFVFGTVVGALLLLSFLVIADALLFKSIGILIVDI